MDFEYIEKQKRNHKYRKQLLKNPTRCELIFKQFLEEEKIRFIFQKGFLKPFHRIVDFYLPGKFIIIEIDGKTHDFTKEKDNRKDYRFYDDRRFATLRIKNSEIYDGSYRKIFRDFIKETCG